MTNGIYPTTPAGEGLWWGTWNEEGDAHTGTLETVPFRLSSQLYIRVAGYPTRPGNRIFVRATDGSDELDVPAPNPGEQWVEFIHTIPAPWVGREVRLIAEDNRKESQGWFAIAPPTSFVEHLYDYRWGLSLGVLVGIALALGRRRLKEVEPHSEKILLGAFAGLMLLHYLAILSFAVDVPFADEWESLAPNALGHDLNFQWLWALHNEHRIILTKLMTWILFRYTGWSIVGQIAANFLIYSAMLYCFYRFVQEHLESRLGVISILAASTVAAENHSWAFQNQFHLFLLFFVLAIWFGARGGRWAWLGTVAAIASIYSFSIGVICGLFCVFYYLYLGLFEFTAQRRGYVARALVISLFLALWFEGFHKNPGHPDLALPFTDAFWMHYLNVLSSGFGYSELNIVPGLIICLVLGGLIMFRLVTVRRAPHRPGWVGLIVVALGLLAGLASVSMARAGFGAAQAKSSRYAEISFLLLPILWLLAVEVTKPYSARARLYAMAAVLIVLYAPFYNDFSWFDVYRGPMYTTRIEARRCIQRSLDRRGDTNCPSAYPGNISHFIERAKELNVSFLRDMPHS